MRFPMFLAALAVGTSLSMAAVDPAYASYYENLPFEMPEVPTPAIPERTVELTDFGAVCDGVTLNTEVFAKAIDHLSSLGGGTLHVPNGVWVTGPIVMKSNINLNLSEGAIISFDPNPDLYPMQRVIYEGFEAWRRQSPITGTGLENVAITGKGIIDGNGNRWRPVKKNQMTKGEWANLTAKGGVIRPADDTEEWFPSQAFLEGKKNGNRRKEYTKEEADSYKQYLRPVMLHLVKCKNVMLKGVTFQNSPAWNLHPLMCENLILDSLNVRNPYYSHNGDGMDIESCRNVIICRSLLDVGDDAICIKSGKDEEGRKRGMPTENVIVRDCRVFHGHGGFVVGSEMSGGVNNISVENCQFTGTDIGLRFKSTRGRGGVVKNIFINNISMVDITADAITFDLYYWTFGQGPKEIPPVDETTPQFKDITIDNVTALNSGKALKFNGIPEMPIENITVSNSVFTAREGGLLSESKNILFHNVLIRPDAGPAMTINNVSDATFTLCRFISPDGEQPVVYTGKNTGIKMGR
ncbi:MAG: glycoside hydrolase family 28 protein [Paenibacillus sp.]|nr:glycoside hydrolase family 28 protein [Paenibacillus sp.]